jgi:hypothetical protein
MQGSAVYGKTPKDASIKASSRRLGAICLPFGLDGATQPPAIYGLDIKAFLADAPAAFTIYYIYDDHEI